MDGLQYVSDGKQYSKIDVSVSAARRSMFGVVCDLPRSALLAVVTAVLSLAAMDGSQQPAGRSSRTLPGLSRGSKLISCVLVLFFSFVLQSGALRPFR